MARSSGIPSKTAPADPASPAVKVTAPRTMALAASTRPRRGLAASVRRIRPRRYSAVMNSAPTTITAISPMNKPASDASSGVAPLAPGAMSPEPVTVKVPPAWRYPAVVPAG